MNRSSVRTLSLLLACATLGSACSTDPEPERLDSLQDRNRRIRTERPEVATEQPTAPTLPAPNGGEPNVLAPARLTLKSGIRIGVANPVGNWADLRLTFAHRPARASELGPALTTARLIAESPLEEARKPSLERQIESLGGRLELEVNAWTTTFDLRVPTARWREAAELLFGAVTTLPKGAQRTEEIARDVTKELARRWLDDPTTALIDRLRSFEGRSIDDWIDEAETTSLTTAQAFLTKNYVAAGATLIARLPNPGQSLGDLSRTAQAFAEARPGEPVPLTPPNATGLYWAPSRVDNGEASIAWIFDLPTPGRLGAEFERTIFELLTIDGVAGRIGAEVRRTIGRSLVFETAVQNEARGRRVVLRTRAPAEAVLPLRNVVQRAVQSLKSDPPSAAEWREAAERALLRLETAVTSRDGYLDLATALLKQPLVQDTHAFDGERAVPVPTTLPDPFATAAALFASLDPSQLKAVVEAIADRPTQLVALGGSPTQSTGVVRVEKAEIDPDRFAVANADDEARLKSANVTWQKTFRAMGGRMRCAAVLGYRSLSTTRTGQGPEMHELTFVTESGRIRSERRILETETELRIDGDTAKQEILGKSSPVDPLDAAGLVQQTLRHPVMLAGRAARAQDRYREISRREAFGRNYAVLERIDDPLSLQVWVDVDSGLIRVVRSLETRATGSVWVREEWFDYRDTNPGVRAPFQCHQRIDDALRGTATEWITFDPRRPTPEQMNDK